MKNLKILNQKKLINNINKSNMFDYVPDESDYLNNKKIIEFGLGRIINIQNLSNIFESALDNTLVKDFSGGIDPTHFDCFLGINLHYELRLSRSEASRPELWNSIIFQIPAAKEYIVGRGKKFTEKFEPKLSNFLISGIQDLHRHNFISSAWWITELTRNGSDYDYSKKAFNCSRYLAERFGTLNYFHNPLFALATVEFLYNFEDRVKPPGIISRRDALSKPPNFGVSIKDFMLSRNTESLYKHANYSQPEFTKWQESKQRNFNKLEGPKDFNIDLKEINKVVNEFESLASLRGWIN